MSRLTRAELDRLRWYHCDSDGALGARAIDYGTPVLGPGSKIVRGGVAGWGDVAGDGPSDEHLRAVASWRHVDTILRRCSRRTRATLAARFGHARVERVTGLRGDLSGILLLTDTVVSLAEVDGSSPIAVLIRLASASDEKSRGLLVSASCEAVSLWDAAEEEYAVARERVLDERALAEVRP